MLFRSKRQINSCGPVLALKANLIEDKDLDQSFCKSFLGMIIFANLLQHANVLSYPLCLCNAMMRPVIILPRFSGYRIWWRPYWLACLQSRVHFGSPVCLDLIDLCRALVFLTSYGFFQLYVKLIISVIGSGSFVTVTVMSLS